MKEDLRAWNAFLETGSVEDYLAYRATVKMAGKPRRPEQEKTGRRETATAM